MLGCLLILAQRPRHITGVIENHRLLFDVFNRPIIAQLLQSLLQLAFGLFEVTEAIVSPAQTVEECTVFRFQCDGSIQQLYCFL